MYSLGFMDCESVVQSSSTIAVQSPATMAAQMDSTFVSKHNASAEIYLSIKDDVDLLFSGSIALNDREHLLMRIRYSLERLVVAFEAEKQYLLGHVLCDWSVRQQKLTIATLWTQQMNYTKLGPIDTQFEYFGELLEQSLSGLNYIMAQCPAQGFEEFYSRIHQITHDFLFYSIIVSKQPPSVVIKCGEAENHRHSKFWFNTEIRVLGGRAFGIHAAAENTTLQCYLITDDTARRMLNNAYHEVFEHEEFVIEPPTANLKSDEQNDFVAKFDDMIVSKKDQLRRDSVATKRYCLCYNVKLSAKHGIDLIGKKVSLPFAILTGPKTDVEAKLFLERSFADLVHKPLSGDVPPSVPYQDMADALEMKFQAILETPQKSMDSIPLVQPRSFTNQAKHHLIHRLKPDDNARIQLENLLKLPVAEQYCLKKKSTTEWEWQLVPFYEWFFKLAEVVNKHLRQMWNDGLIFGFCSKDEAEHLLKECRNPTLLIRFSDIEFTKIKISVRDRSGVIRHHWYDQQDLLARSLQKELLKNSKYFGIEYIYPNIPLEQALGGREQPTDHSRKPRLMQPSAAYFDNQESALSTL